MLRDHFYPDMHISEKKTSITIHCPCRRLKFNQYRPNHLKNQLFMSGPTVLESSCSEYTTWAVLFGDMISINYWNLIKIFFERIDIICLRLIFASLLESTNTNFRRTEFRIREPTAIWMWLRTKSVLRSHACKCVEIVQCNTENQESAIISE
jgi:hypothetical protein